MSPKTITMRRLVAASFAMTAATALVVAPQPASASSHRPLDEQRFATKNDCTEHQWSTGFSNGGWWPGWLH
jgi:hypothetical protein